MMEHDTGDIVEMVVVDKWEVGLKSPNMEKLAFKKGLDNLLGKNLKIKEVVTDGHIQIKALLSKLILKISYSSWTAIFSEQ